VLRSSAARPRLRMVTVETILARPRPASTRHPAPAPPRKDTIP
jgi:hypothetical protein